MRCDTEGTLVWGRSWCWAAGDTESSKRRNTSNAITPGASSAPQGISSASLAPPAILTLNLGFSWTFSCAPSGDTQPWNREKTKKCTNAPGNFCLDPAAGIDCHQKPPAWQSTPGFVFVGRKKTCSVSHSVSTSLLASVKLLRCYRWDSVTEVLSLKPSKFWVFIKRSKFWVFMDILMKWLSMMANTFSPKQCVVMHVCSVHHAHGGVRLWLL